MKDDLSGTHPDIVIESEDTEKFTLSSTGKGIVAFKVLLTLSNGWQLPFASFNGGGETYVVDMVCDPASTTITLGTSVTYFAV